MLNESSWRLIGCRCSTARDGNQYVAGCRVSSDSGKYQLIRSGIGSAGKVDWVLRTLVTQPHKAAIAGDLDPPIDLLSTDVGVFDRHIDAVGNLLRAAFLQFEINALPIDLITEVSYCCLIRTDPPVHTGQIVASRLMYLLN